VFGNDFIICYQKYKSLRIIYTYTFIFVFIILDAGIMNTKIKIDKTCLECKTKRGKMSSAFSVYLCEDCKFEDAYILITKTNTKKNYFLTDDELVNLRAIHKNSSYGPATYFTKRDILAFLCIKYNVDYDDILRHVRELRKEKEEQKKERNIRAQEKKQKEKEKRRKKLIAALAEYKLVLRSDSVLCERYIDGYSNFTLEEIVSRMCEMKFLYEYCHMDECREEAYQENVETLRAGYFPDMTVSENAEYIALKKYSNGEYPRVFPWMITTSV
jgi:hypothetical protein